MAERWDTARVLSLAPDASSQRAAQSLAAARGWLARGGTGTALWGECEGSAARPYQTAVDLSGPAYKCSCPSRKSPCKHALALLLLWSRDEVPDAGAPGWAQTWLTTRAAKSGGAGAAGPADPEAARRRAEQRQSRVASGLDELDRWLCDQVGHGLADTPRAGYLHWDTIAARMVDAQAPSIADRLRSLAAVPHSGAGWEGRLLEEYALLRLLITGYRRREELPADLIATVRSRIGFPVRQADVLSHGQHVTDRWLMLGRHDLEQERIRARRTWLRGEQSGRLALVLSFAAAGESFDVALPPGSQTSLELAFYPGAAPLRALIVTGGDPAPAAPPPGGTIAGLLTGWARALAGDPWLDWWPAILAEVTAVRDPAPRLAGPAGAALPLHPAAGDCWPLFAVSGGAPVTVAAEWTPRGLWPLTVWDETGQAVPL